MLNQKSVLVTGANGLLGRNVCSELRKNNSVWGVVHSLPKIPLANVNYIEADLGLALDTASLPQKVDVIIHLAQSQSFRDFPGKALDVFKVNVASTAQLLDYAMKIGVSQFVYASSGGIYGNSSEALRENAPITPPGNLGYYLGSKACGEILVQSYASMFQVTVLRPFFIYGPGQNRGMLIPRLMDSVASGKPISLQGSEGIRINPVHVEDASAAVVAALNTKKSATYNIAGPDVLSIREIVEAIGEHLRKAPTFQHVGGEPKDLIADISAMRDQLIEPRRHFSESLVDIQF